MLFAIHCHDGISDSDAFSDSVLTISNDKLPSLIVQFHVVLVGWYGSSSRLLHWIADDRSKLAGAQSRVQNKIF